MLKNIILVLLVTSLNSLFAQELPVYLRAETKQANTNKIEEPSTHHKLNHFQKYGDVEKRTYDVLNYDYYIDLSGALNASLESSKIERKSFSGSNNITLVMLEDTNVFEFDANNMTINSVIFTKESVPVMPTNTDYTIENGILKLYYPTDLHKGDTLSINISFTGLADDNADYINNRGLHIYNKGYFIGDINSKKDSVFVDHNIAYSMSEPDLASYWMPCNDRPYDKATSSISVKVPLGYNVASNGYLDRIDTLKNEKVEYFWKNDTPIATYLMCFAASIFDEYHQTAIVDGDTIPIVHYAWPEDINGDYFKLIPSMKTHPQMLDVLINHYGPYPFNKYGTVTVYPFPYGGMEHQTMVTQLRFWIRDNGDGGFVHEMGHHWFGDMMTCATWADVWINEGGATFTEAMYFGSLDSSLYSKVMQAKINYYLKLNESNNGNSMYAVPMSTFFGSESYLIYEKGAIFLHQMKENLGDEEFYRILKEIFQDYKYKSITTEQYKQAWKEKAVNPLVDIDNFFNQWVYSAGNPEYTIQTKLKDVVDGKYKIEIEVEQVQSKNPQKNTKVPNLFITPIKFIFSNNDIKEYSEQLLNNQTKQTYTFLLDYIPSSVDIDELTVLHKTISSVITSVELKDYVSGIDLYPNPSTIGYSQLNLNIKNSVKNANIVLSDILGNKIETIYNGRMETGSMGYKILTNQLSKGIYIVNINLDGVNTSKKLVVQ